MTTQNQPGITRVSYAADTAQEPQVIALVEPGTKQLAHLAALEVIATPEITARRDDLVTKAKAITTITTDDQAKTATELAGKLKGLRNEVEKARESVKRPVLIIGNAIESVAKATSEPAICEMKRLERIGGDYIAEKEAKRQAEIRRQEAEIKRRKEEAAQLVREAQEKAARIEREAQAKAADELRKQEEEARRKQAGAEAEISRQKEEARKAQDEANRKASEANAAERAKLQAEADKLRKANEAEQKRLKEESERLQIENEKLLEQKRMEAEFDAETRAEEAREAEAKFIAEATAPIFATQVAEIGGVRGASVAKGWDHEVTDLAALYAYNPACVELVARKSVIKGVVDAAAQQAGNQPFTIPGLRIFPKTKLTARSI
jgi:hypothetical protein